MADILKEINEIIKEAIEENEGEEKVSELNFSQKDLSIGKLTSAMKTAIEQCPNVDFLGLSDCKLNSLENFPHLPKLDTIDLKDNDLNDDEVRRLGESHALKNLYIEGNNVEKIETLEELAKTLTQLNTLEIGNNPVTGVAGFSARLWKAFSTLQVLNQHDRSGNKIQENAEGDDDGEDDQEEEDDYEVAEESQDSQFSEGDYDSQNEKPKKKRKNK